MWLWLWLLLWLLVFLLDLDEFLLALLLDFEGDKVDQGERGLAGFDLALLELEVGDKEGLPAVGDEGYNLERGRLLLLLGGGSSGGGGGGRGSFCGSLGGLGGTLFVLLDGLLDDVHRGVVRKEVACKCIFKFEIKWFK